MPFGNRLPVFHSDERQTRTPAAGFPWRALRLPGVRFAKEEVDRLYSWKFPAVAERAFPRRRNRATPRPSSRLLASPKDKETSPGL